MNVCRYFAEYRYRPPMPLEDVSKHYFYCTPGGLPPLAPRKKKVKPTRTINTKNKNQKNNNNNINTPPTTTTAIVTTVPTTPTTLLPTATTAADVDYFEEEPCTPCWWGWTVYYWFMHTYPRWYKFFGLIYLFLVDFFTGKDREDAGDDNDNNTNINININHQTEEEEDEDEDEWIHGESHTNYYDDEVPIEDEFAPPETEKQLDFEALRLLLLPQQEEEPIATSSVSDIATTIDNAPYYDSEDDDDDDGGSDYYFSLPSENAINSSIAMGVYEGVEAAIEDVNFGMAEEESIAFDATEDVVEAPIVTDDATEDAKASMNIDEVSTTETSTSNTATTTTTADALGSIWVPDPKYGMVRRSARLRVRG